MRWVLCGGLPSCGVPQALALIVGFQTPLLIAASVSGGAMEKIETYNKFAVGLHGEDIVILFPPGKLTKSDARLLAAYLVALSSPGPDGREEFNKVLDAVLDT